MYPKAKIMVIEDDDDIAELVRYNLEQEGYSVTILANGTNAAACVAREKPDLVILDLLLPGVGGLDICKALKSDDRARHIPIIMVTARGEESDIVFGLELGAADYVNKPFSPRVLMARVKAVLRRPLDDVQDQTVPVSHGDLNIDPARYEVLVMGKRVSLTVTEFGVLYVLARKPGWVFTRYQIVDAVKGEDYAVTERAVDVQMVGLRKKLGRCADYIETIRGVGYRMKELTHAP